MKYNFLVIWLPLPHCRSASDTYIFYNTFFINNKNFNRFLMIFSNSDKSLAEFCQRLKVNFFLHNELYFVEFICYTLL